MSSYFHAVVVERSQAIHLQALPNLGTNGSTSYSRWDASSLTEVSLSCHFKHWVW